MTLINSCYCCINITGWFMLTLIILMGGVRAIFILGAFYKAIRTSQWRTLLYIRISQQENMYRSYITTIWKVRNNNLNFFCFCFSNTLTILSQQLNIHPPQISHYWCTNKFGNMVAKSAVLLWNMATFTLLLWVVFEVCGLKWKPRQKHDWASFD